MKFESEGQVTITKYTVKEPFDIDGNEFKEGDIIFLGKAAEGDIRLYRDDSWLKWKLFGKAGGIWVLEYLDEGEEYQPPTIP